MAPIAPAIASTPRDPSALHATPVELSPWQLILAVTLPFWVFMTATRIAMFLLTTSRNPLVIISPPGVRLFQHLLLLPILLLAYRAAVAVLRKEPATAEQMLVGLSDLLRRTLRDGETEQVPLEREADFVRKYLEIQRLRFNDRLTFAIDVPEETRRALVPGLLLQPLAENAVVHGVAHEEDSVRIDVRARRDEERLVLEVENSAAAQPTSNTGHGIGLAATRERLRAMFGAQHDIELATRADGSVVARVSIPFIDAGTVPAT